MKINIAMKNYSNIQTLFKVKLKHEFRIMIIIIKLNIQKKGFFFTTIQIRAKNYNNMLINWPFEYHLLITFIKKYYI